MKTFFCMIFTFFVLQISLNAEHFEILPLSEEAKAQMVETGVWSSNCPVSMDRLRLVEFTHFDFSRGRQRGRIVVLDALAEKVASIFKTLYKYQFPIACAIPMEQYDGNDARSMAANNTSAFNYRTIASTTIISIHSYGVAIDVNPVQNPCVVPQISSDPEEIFVSVQPAEGQYYLNRTNIRPGMAEQILDKDTGLSVVELFKQNGFCVWGGKWNNPVDWQHFQPSRATAEWLAFMSPKDAARLFEFYIANPCLLNDAGVRLFDFESLYKRDSRLFMQALKAPDFWEMKPENAYEFIRGYFW